MSNTTFRMFTEKLGGTSSTVFKGNAGDIFFDPAVGALRFSDGVTAGGKPVELAEASTQIPVTNQYFVDPSRTDTYTSSGNILTPFKTIGAALTAIEAAVTAGSITPGESSPVFIILCANTTENITLTRGHVFITTLNGSIHAPIYLFGTITISGTNTSASALDINHFSITGLTINAATQKACIYFTGANAQRVMLQSVWMTATGAQTGTTPFTDAGGYGVYADCTGIRASDSHKSMMHGNDIKISHNGTGDVYCIRVGAADGTSRVAADFSGLETSGATQVGSVASNCTLSFTGSQLDANGDTCVETYGTGTLTVTLSSITNTQTNSSGVRINTTGGTAILGNNIFNIPAGTGKAVYGVSGATLIHAGNVFIYGSNTAKTAAITAVALPSAFT